ncbi:MAG: hypothetical protein LBR80_02845 [Deltaproteobacteria bacterium]|nr:hypothetical protein [Deltaproteobacteria bacterium]
MEEKGIRVKTMKPRCVCKDILFDVKQADVISPYMNLSQNTIAVAVTIDQKTGIQDLERFNGYAITAKFSSRPGHHLQVPWDTQHVCCT